MELRSVPEERRRRLASTKRGDGGESLLLGGLKEVKQRRFTDVWGWGEMQGQDADTVARLRDG